MDTCRLVLFGSETLFFFVYFDKKICFACGLSFCFFVTGT